MVLGLVVAKELGARLGACAGSWALAMYAYFVAHKRIEILLLTSLGHEHVHFCNSAPRQCLGVAPSIARLSAVRG